MTTQVGLLSDLRTGFKSSEYSANQPSVTHHSFSSYFLSFLYAKCFMTLGLLR